MRIDAIKVVPDLDVPLDSTFCTAAAATYSNYPGSANTTDRGRRRCRWASTSREYRHFVLFYTSFYTAGQLAAIAANYVQVPGQTVNPTS